MRATSTILNSPACSASIDPLGLRLATAAHDIIQLWQSDTAGSGSWVQTAEINTDSPVTQLRWAPQQYGTALTSGHHNGSGLIHEEALVGRDSAWECSAALKGNGSPVAVLEFGPSDQGACMASAAGSHVRLFQFHSGEGWAPTSAFEAGAEVTAVSWRQHSNDAPAMLLVASGGGGVAIWAFQAGLNTWQRMAELGDGGDEVATAVCWAPLTGRTTDMVAVGAGRVVSMWDVSISKDGVQADITATLDIGAPVQQVQFNFLGNWLAVTDTSSVQLWRATLGAASSWAMLSRIASRPPDFSTDALEGDADED